MSNRSISRAASARYKPLITPVSESEAFNLNINGGGGESNIMLNNYSGTARGGLMN